jgi:hypothetical protein
MQELDGILGTLQSVAIGISRDGLLAAFEAPRAAQEELSDIAAKLEARSSQVSFKDRYTAVLALQAKAALTAIQDSMTSVVEERKAQAEAEKTNDADQANIESNAGATTSQQ